MLIISGISSSSGAILALTNAVFVKSAFAIAITEIVAAFSSIATLNNPPSQMVVYAEVYPTLAHLAEWSYAAH